MLVRGFGTVEESEFEKSGFHCIMEKAHAT